MIQALLARWGLTVLGWLAAAAAVLAILFGARQAGRNAERVEHIRKSVEIKDAQLRAALRRPRTRADLVDRMRDGTF